MNQQNLVALRNVLVELYPDEASIRRVAADAGIHSARIAFTAIAVNAWHSLLAEAEKLGRVNALLGVVEDEYGDNEKFRDACAVYRQAVGKSSRPNLDAQITVKDAVAPKRWFALFSALLLIGIAGGGWYWGLLNGGREMSGAPAATITLLNSPTPERQVEIVAIPSRPMPTETFTLVPTMPATKSVATATATVALPTDTAIPTDMPTLSPTSTLEPTATETSTPVPSYPCDATTTTKSNANAIRLLISPAGGVRKETIPVRVTVQILKRLKDEGLAEIWYEKEKVGGWVYDENLIPSDSCPK